MLRAFLDTHDLSDYRFRRDIFPDVTDRAFWQAFPSETYVKEAEEAIDYAWPVIKATDFMEYKKSGNRKIMENVHFDRRSHLVLFALAELKENKGRFLPQIVNGLFTICEETYWGLSAHWLHKLETGNIPSPVHPYIDLFAAETAEHLAMIAYLLEQPLRDFCPEILDRVAHELDRRIKTPYESRYDFWWMGHGGRRVNNWNPWILSNLFTVFLLCERDEARRARAVRKMLYEAQFYYDAIPEDGGCDEGPGYWQRAGASLFELLYQLKCATEGAIDLFDDEKIARIASYMKRVHIAADLFVNVADAHAKGLALYMPLLFSFAREVGDAELMSFSVSAYRAKTRETRPLDYKQRTIRRIIYNARALQEMEHYEVQGPIHGAREYLPDLELAVLRCGDMVLSAKGGHNAESHNHNDVGSFTLYENTTPVLVDIGIGTYTKDTFSRRRYITIPWVRTAYHNLPLLNGVEQQDGAEYRAERFEVSDKGVEISYPAAYPCEAGVATLTRSLELSDRGVSVTDRGLGTDGAPCRISEVLMCVLPVRIEDGAAIIGERYRLCVSAGAIRAEQVPFDDALLCSDWQTEYATRIIVECENKQEICMKVEKL